MLDIAESNGASSSFADNDVIGSWAKGYVNAMSEKGLISGVGQNRFAPTENITRGAVVTILDHAIKGLCTEAKEYVGNVDGTVIVNANGTVLKNMAISGDLIISEGVGKGDVILDNVTVSGKTIVRGGGENSIHVKGSSRLGEVIVIKMSDGAVSIKVAEDAKVDTIIAKDSSLTVSGKVEHLRVTGSVAVTTTGATIKEVDITGDATVMLDKDSKVETLTVGARSSVTVAGTVTKLVVSSSADDATIAVAEGATVSTLVTDATIKVDNKGVITKAEVNADDVVIGGKVPTTTVVGKEVKTLPVDKDGKTIAMTAPAEKSKGGGGGGGGSHSSHKTIAVSAINETTLEVTLSDGSTVEQKLDTPLDEGENLVVIEYDGVTRKVTWTPEAPTAAEEFETAKAELEKLEADLAVAEEDLKDATSAEVADAERIRDDLLKDVDQLKNEVSALEAEAAVEKAEETFEEADVDAAQLRVNGLAGPAAAQKEPLSKRLQAVEKVIEAIVAAKVKVGAAEDYINTKDFIAAKTLYDEAVELVKALDEGEVKTDLEEKLAKVEEAIAQAEVDAMVKELVIRQTSNSWSITLQFEEININTLDSLTIALYDGDRMIAEQKATEKTLTDLEQPGLSSPFYKDGTKDLDYWTITKDLLAGTPDKVVITFEFDGETYTVESIHSQL